MRTRPIARASGIHRSGTNTVPNAAGAVEPPVLAREIRTSTMTVARYGNADMNCEGIPKPAPVQLKDRHGAEQICPDHEEARPPRREHDQRKRDPSAASRHARNEERCIGQRQIGSGKARAGAAEHHREQSYLEHRISQRVCRNVIVADRPQHQSCPRPVKKQPDADEQRQREINESVLAEQDASYQRNIGEARDVKMRRRRHCRGSHR